MRMPSDTGRLASNRFPDCIGAEHYLDKLYQSGEAEQSDGLLTPLSLQQMVSFFCSCFDFLQVEFQVFGG
jgi:hypothetical protein